MGNLAGFPVLKVLLDIVLLVSPLAAKRSRLVGR